MSRWNSTIKEIIGPNAVGIYTIYYNPTEEDLNAIANGINIHDYCRYRQRIIRYWDSGRDLSDCLTLFKKCYPEFPIKDILAFWDFLKRKFGDNRVLQKPKLKVTCDRGYLIWLGYTDKGIDNIKPTK
jgi:hypothetical protein